MGADTYATTCPNCYTSPHVATCDGNATSTTDSSADATPTTNRATNSRHYVDKSNISHIGWG